MVATASNGEREPSFLGKCIRYSTASTIVLVVESVVCSLAILGCIYSVYQGNYFGGISTASVVAVTLTTVALFHRAIRAGNPNGILPYLIWKPVQILLELSSVIYFAILARATWNQAVQTALQVCIKWYNNDLLLH